MENKKNLRKNDLLLLLIVVVVAASICALRFWLGDKHPGYVTVRIDGEVVASYDLSEDQEVELNGGTNTMRIEDGTVKMIQADCPDKLCMKQKAISKNRENIICLPNNIVLQIANQDESELDAVTN